MPPCLLLVNEWWHWLEGRRGLMAHLPCCLEVVKLWWVLKLKVAQSSSGDGWVAHTWVSLTIENLDPRSQLRNKTPCNLAYPKHCIYTTIILHTSSPCLLAFHYECVISWGPIELNQLSTWGDCSQHLLRRRGGQQRWLLLQSPKIYIWPHFFLDHVKAYDLI